MLQKLLRGEVAIEMENPSAVVPVNNGRSLGDLPSTTKGSFLFNTYKQCGGFLGFGRGYYANRSKNKEVIKSDANDFRGRMIAISKWSNHSRNKCESNEHEELTSDATFRVFSPCDTPSVSNNEAMGTFRITTSSQSGLPASGIQNKFDAAQKTVNQGSVYKKMCEEMCNRIVKEHPFIVPFLNRDLLKELELGVSEESETADSRTASSVNRGPKKRYQTFQPSSYEPTPVVNGKSNINKKIRSLSKTVQAKNKSPAAELVKRGSSVQKNLSTAGPSKKSESAIPRKSTDIKPEYRRLHNIASPAYEKISRKNLKRGRSCSLSGKYVKNDSEEDVRRTSIAFDITEIALDILTDTKICTVTSKGICEDPAEKGSSVDPRTAAAENETKPENVGTLCEKHLEGNNQSDEKALAIPLHDVSKSNGAKYEKHFLRRDHGTSAESRMSEIISALASWGFPIKAEIEHKETESVSANQEISLQSALQPCASQPDAEETTAASRWDSKELLDFIKNLASSNKNRKLLRQISNVLNKNKVPRKLHEHSKTFPRTRTLNASRFAALRATGITKSTLSLHQAKEKISIDNSKGTEALVLQSKSHTDSKRALSSCKRRCVARESSESAKFSQERKSPASKRVNNNEKDMNQISLIPASNAEISSITLQTEQGISLHSSPAPVKNQQKIRQRYQLKRPLVRNMRRRGLNEAKTSNIPGNKSQSPGFQSQQHDHSQGQGDSVKVDEVCECDTDNRKAGCEKTHDSVSKTKSEDEIKRNHDDQMEEKIPNNEQEKECEINMINYKPKDHQDACLKETEPQTKEMCNPAGDLCNQLIRFATDAENEVQGAATNIFCAKVLSTKQPGDGYRLLKNGRFQSPKAKEREKSVSEKSVEQINVEKPSEQKNLSMRTGPKNMMLARNELKMLVSSSAEKSFDPVQVKERRFGQALNKPVATNINIAVGSNKHERAVKVSRLMKKSSPISKSGHRQSQKQAQANGKAVAIDSFKTTQQRACTIVKHRQQDMNERVSVLSHKSRENSQVAAKAIREKSAQRRSRFDQYHKNKKLINNNSSPVRTSKRYKKELSELGQNTNQTSYRHQQVKAEVDYKVMSDESTELPAVNSCTVVPLNFNITSKSTELQASCVQSQCRDMPLSLRRSSVETELSPDGTIRLHFDAQPLFTADSLSAPGKQNCAQIVNRCIFLQNKSFQRHEMSQAEEENVFGKETDNEPNFFQSSGLLKKSLLDDVVRGMKKAKPIACARGTSGGE